MCTSSLLVVAPARIGCPYTDTSQEQSPAKCQPNASQTPAKSQPKASAILLLTVPLGSQTRAQSATATVARSGAKG